MSFTAVLRNATSSGLGAPLFMMLSNGGLTHIAEAKRVPVQMLESGPAAGALARRRVRRLRCADSTGQCVKVWCDCSAAGTGAAPPRAVFHCACERAHFAADGSAQRRTQGPSARRN